MNMNLRLLVSCAVLQFVTIGNVYAFTPVPVIIVRQQLQVWGDSTTDKVEEVAVIPAASEQIDAVREVILKESKSGGPGGNEVSLVNISAMER